MSKIDLDEFKEATLQEVGELFYDEATDLAQQATEELIDSLIDIARDANPEIQGRILAAISNAFPVDDEGEESEDDEDGEEEESIDEEVDE